MAKLKDLAQLIRSKNAGPFVLTFDIMFDSMQDYLRPRLWCHQSGAVREPVRHAAGRGGDFPRGHRMQRSRPLFRVQRSRASYTTRTPTEARRSTAGQPGDTVISRPPGAAAREQAARPGRAVLPRRSTGLAAARDAAQGERRRMLANRVKQLYQQERPRSAPTS